MKSSVIGISIVGIVTCVSMADRIYAQAWTNQTLTASQRASLLVNAMSSSELASMVEGTSGSYSGNIAPIPALSVPSLNLQDGPAGIGESATNVTAFPAPITLAATWDVPLAQQYGVMLGSEAHGKGVNVLLGPMMNDGRVYEDGRSFEASGGEDPYLSSAMASAEVQGIQSQGVISTAKHFVCYDQETQRTLYSSDVDERTRQEVYYPAFRACVRAGVGAVMSSYNRVNSRYAGESPELNATLRKLWGFNGFVMSDWSATYTTVAGMNNGQDMDMHSGNPASTRSFLINFITNAIQSGDVPAYEMTGMVQSIATSMFQAGLFDNTNAGNLGSNVTGTAHALFARQVAAEGAVLLQNNGGILPLNTNAIHSIAVIGSVASVSPISTGAGSAAVVLPYNITPLEGITNRAGSSIVVNYSQGDGASVSAAAELASTSDVAIVCVGQQTDEGVDRTNLSLPDGQDALISAVAAANPNTIVVIYDSSSVLMPWANQVAGILFAWYPGEENGNALAEVLFGDVNPSGKLPVTIPAAAADVCAGTTQQWPGLMGHVTYSEGLQVGYRWYDANNVAPLFPFGFGLSYTTFGYSNLTVSAVSASGQVQVGFDLTDTGSQAGAEVPQLYLGFPAAAGEPPKLLKGFQRVTLSPGQTQHVTFNLDWEDIANWDQTARGWIVTPGTFQVMVGASSRDLRLTGSFSVSSVPSSDLANAALHQAVIVSSTLSSNTPGSTAVDGNPSTSWSSQTSDPQWIAVDLGMTRDLSRVRLRWNTNYASSYAIQTSPDETNWTSIYSTNSGGGGVDDVLVSGRSRYVRLYATTQAMPGNGYSLSELEIYSQPQEPFGGAVNSLPGIIEAGNYDTGGEGVAYYNTTNDNPNAIYRADDVGIEPCGDTNGGYDITGLNNEEWLEYTVNPPDPEAIYSISARVASATGGGQLRVRLNGTVLGTIQIPNTGGTQTWQTVTLPNDVPISGGMGSQAMRLEVLNNGFNLNWIQLNRVQVCGTNNIALDQPISASSTNSSSYLPTYANDGSLTTYWSSKASDPQSITVDLGKVWGLTRVRLNWESAYAVSYSIQISTDSNTWTTVYTTTNGAGSIADLAALGNGRYVRMNSTQRIYSSDGDAIWEFEVYPTLAPEILQNIPTRVELPSGMSYTYSIEITGAPCNYQWYSLSTPIIGQTNPIYTVTAGPPGNSSSYYVIATNIYGAVTSSVSIFTNVPPLTTNSYDAEILRYHPIAYWRLNEADDGLHDGNNGTVAFDFVGGHNGLYNNADLGLQAFNPANFPDETAAGFGMFASQDSYVGEMNNYGIAPVNLTVSAGSNAEFSVEALASFVTDSVGGGVVGQGLALLEQYYIDTGTSGHHFRFFIRTAAGSAVDANTTNTPVLNNNTWYHLVGVCDEANSNVLIYINGKLAASATVAPLSGLNPYTAPVSIGSRPNGSDAFASNVQVYGSISDVAIYNYVLTPAQIAAHYQATELAPPTINTTPTNIVFAVTNNQLMLSWPADHTGWALQAQTNTLTSGIGTNWFYVADSSSTNQVFLPMNSGNDCAFYRLVCP